MLLFFLPSLLQAYHELFPCLCFLCLVLNQEAKEKTTEPRFDLLILKTPVSYSNTAYMHERGSRVAPTYEGGPASKPGPPAIAS